MFSALLVTIRGLVESCMKVGEGFCFDSFPLGLGGREWAGLEGRTGRESIVRVGCWSGSAVFIWSRLLRGW
jgi:hypothetical protein